MIIHILKTALLFTPVVLGGLIYIIFRTDRLIMFHWFEYLNLSDEINTIKSLKNILSLPDWFIYSLPDGLWIFSYIHISLEIWKFSITRQNIFWIFSIPITAIASEIFQLFKIIPGTFDLVDIIFYLIGIALPFIKILNTTYMKNIKQIISAGLFLFFLLVAFGSMDDKKTKDSSYQSLNSYETPDVHPQEIEAQNTDPKKDAIIIKLKAKAKQDWPNDYSTQEYWINQQIEAYDYMETIEDNPIKKQAQRDWPLDFSTQKYWYEQQVEAKNRIE